jgi:hypothetical protein
VSRRAATAAEMVAPSPLAHDSAVVWCDKRQAWAVVSTIERRGAAPALHYVQWCSLVGLDVGCAENCRCLEGARRTGLPPGGDKR